MKAKGWINNSAIALFGMIGLLGLGLCIDVHMEELLNLCN